MKYLYIRTIIPFMRDRVKNILTNNGYKIEVETEIYGLAAEWSIYTDREVDDTTLDYSLF
jgi:hypothetical protein